MARVFLSLGSNMGDRAGNISQAVSLLSISDKIKVHDVIKSFKMRNELKNKLPDNISKITFDKLFGKIILKKLISNHY